MSLKSIRPYYWKGFLWEQLGVSSPNSQPCQSVTTSSEIDFVWTKMDENNAYIAIYDWKKLMTIQLITSFRIFIFNPKTI
jgi:hypothetical protein